MEGPPIIVFKDVSFAFPGKAPLFEGISPALEAGAFYLVHGPSGAGKSTFLRLINRLEEPISGRIEFKERGLNEIHPPLLRRSILYIQQTPTVTEADVRDNLMLPFTFRNNGDLKKPDDEALRRELDALNMPGVALDEPAPNLSVGQQQRLCLIRGLLLAPEVILLDEPVSALDAESARLVEDKAESLCIDRGLTVVMITHQRFEPRRVTPRRLIVGGGSVGEA